MNTIKGRKWLSQRQRDEVKNLETKPARSKLPDSKVKFTKKDQEILDAYYKMIDYLGAVNG